MTRMSRSQAPLLVVPVLASLAFAYAGACGGTPELPTTPSLPPAMPSDMPAASATPTPSATPAASATAATPPAPAPDPLEAGPNNYKKLAENDLMRVLEVSFKPGDKIPRHRHPDHVVYIVSGGKLKITSGDKPAQELDLKAGDGVFIAAEEHSAENTGKTDLKAVVVELKGKTPTAAPAGPDALTYTGYKKVFENDKVRLLEGTIKAGGKATPHNHPDNVHYVVAGGKLKVTVGKDTQTIEVQTGQAILMPAVLHQGENIGKTDVKVAVVELKGGTPAAPADKKPADKPADKKPADKPADKK
jgi:quercetin dioxygenase-like cupin family protein